jgi:hypothetical protein
MFKATEPSSKGGPVSAEEYRVRSLDLAWWRSRLERRTLEGSGGLV